MNRRVTASTPSGPAEAVPDKKGRTLRSDAFRRLRKNKLAVAGGAIVAFVVLVAVSADLWVPRVLGDPVKVDSATVRETRLLPPSWEHPFGTDSLGRDVASRVIYGAQKSLIVGVVSVAIMVVVGVLLGSLSAYYGGVWDAIIMRTADVFYAFPYVLFAIILVALFGKSFWNMVLAIGIVGWPIVARVFRSSAVSVKETEYVDAARGLGASTWRILARHIVPNSIGPVVVYGTMSVGGAILAEAALSFLGVGVQFPEASWGLMLAESRSSMSTYPWLMLWPGFAIVFTVLGFMLLGDGLRDALDVRRN
jgi:peptide/nickel transport system permease protein